MKLSNLISEEDFKIKKEYIETDKKTLKKLVDNSDNRQGEWVEIMEKAMDFAQNARERFATTTDPRVKKEIVFNLGSNFVLYDRIITLDIDSPLKLVEKIAPEVKKVNKRLELRKTPVKQGELEIIYSQNSIMGG